MREPLDPGWPEHGARTDKASTARKWRAKYEEHYESGLVSESGRRGRYGTLPEATDAWLKHREAQFGADSSTVSGSRTAVKHLLEIAGGDISFRAITQEKLQDWVDARLAEGYAPSTLGGYRDHLSKFFSWLGGHDPTEGVSITAAPESKKQAWKEERQRAAVRVAAREIDAENGHIDPSHGLLVELLFGAGLRIQEAAAANWEDIDSRERTIDVSKQFSRSGEIKLPKGGKTRTAVVLPSWWAHHKEDRTGLIVRMPDGSPVPYRDLSDMVAAVLERAGLKVTGECAHAFRHTYSYLMLSSGASMEELQKSLGHGNIRTTQKHYDHWSPDHAARSGVESIYGRGKRKRK